MPSGPGKDHNGPTKVTHAPTATPLTMRER